MNLFKPFQISAAGPRVEMVRHELKRRLLRVEKTRRVTPGMLRITFSGEDLADFASLAFDDHVKLFAPTPSGEIERRDYTPRRYDNRTRALVIDFAVHDAGPATRWALDARPGDEIEIAGPKGSKVIDARDVRRWLLIGDETALPAIGRHIEQSGLGAEITSVVAITGPEERQDFATEAHLADHWVHRPLSAAADAGALLAEVRTLQIPADTFVWIAGEAGVARTLRNHFIEERRHPARWVKAAGYWIMGQADAHERIS